MINKDLKKNIGVVRGYSKMQFKKLLKNYLKNGFYENLGQNTLRKTNNRKYNYEIVSSELNNYIFFEGVDFEKYNF